MNGRTGTPRRGGAGLKALAAVGLLFIGSVLGGVAVGQGLIPGSDGTIHGCYGADAHLRVVGDPSQCRPNETPLSWNQRGPEGPPGPAGIPSAQSCPAGEFVTAIGTDGSLTCAPTSDGSGGGGSGGGGGDGAVDCDDGDPDTLDSFDPNTDTCTHTAIDGDGDGFGPSEDCDDSDPAVHPGATERANGIDDDCDGEVDEASVAISSVNPTVVYNGINTAVTIMGDWTSSESVSSVSLANSNGATTPLPLSFTQDTTTGAVTAVVPSGLTAAAYSVTVTLSDGASGTLPGALSVSDNLTVAIEAVAPSTVASTSQTTVAVTAADPAPAGYVQFDSGVAVYLWRGAGASDVATSLAVSWTSSTSLDAIVPAGMATGTYDVVVVNPDGSVGVLSDALAVS